MQIYFASKKPPKRIVKYCLQAHGSVQRRAYAHTDLYKCMKSWFGSLHSYVFEFNSWVLNFGENRNLECCFRFYKCDETILVFPEE